MSAAVQVLFSRLVERFLIDGYKPQRLSTFALNLFRHRTTINDEKILIGESPRFTFFEWTPSFLMGLSFAPDYCFKMAL